MAEADFSEDKEPVGCGCVLQFRSDPDLAIEALKRGLIAEGFHITGDDPSRAEGRVARRARIADRGILPNLICRKPEAIEYHVRRLEPKGAVLGLRYEGSARLKTFAFLLMAGVGGSAALLMISLLVARSVDPELALRLLPLIVACLVGVPVVWGWLLMCMGSVEVFSVRLIDRLNRELGEESDVLFRRTFNPVYTSALLGVGIGLASMLLVLDMTSAKSTTARLLLWGLALLVPAFILCLLHGSRTSRSIGPVATTLSLLLPVYVYGSMPIWFPAFLAHGLEEAERSGFSTAAQGFEYVAAFLPWTVLAALTFLIFVVGRDLGVQFVRVLDGWRRHAAERTGGPSARLALTLVVSGITLLGAVCSLACVLGRVVLLDYSLFGQAHLVPTPTGMRFGTSLGQMIDLLRGDSLNLARSQGAARLFTGLYACPVLCLAGFVVVRHLRGASASRYAQAHWRVSVPEVWRQLVSRMAAFAGERCPRLLVSDQSGLDISTLVPAWPTTCPTIVLSDSLLRRFEPLEVEALVAHEVGHIVRRHALRLGLVTFLARWTLLGEGFLVSMVPDSRELELAADAWAVRWLEMQHGEGSRRVLVTALERLEQDRDDLAARDATLVNQGSKRPTMAQGDWLTPEVRGLVGAFSQLSAVQQVIANLRILSYLYLRAGHLDYVHPPLSVRVEHILNVEVDSMSYDQRYRGAGKERGA